MSRVAAALRIDRDTWQWLEWAASWWASSLMVSGAYLLLAFDRFGWPNFALRPTVRFLLTGLYGWLWLSVASGASVRALFGVHSALPSLFRLTGHAHMPLLLQAILIQVLAVTFDIANVARGPALFVGLFWMPAMLINAVAAACDVSLPKAAGAVAVPYFLWAAVVGRYLWTQLGHLL